MTLIDTTTDALGTAATNVGDVAEEIAASAAGIVSDAYEAAVAQRASSKNRVLGLAAVVAIVIAFAIVVKRRRGAESSDSESGTTATRDAATSPLRAAS